MMGFSEEWAVVSLQQCKMDPDSAVDFILEMANVTDVQTDVETLYAAPEAGEGQTVAAAKKKPAKKRPAKKKPAKKAAKKAPAKKAAAKKAAPKKAAARKRAIRKASKKNS